MQIYTDASYNSQKDICIYGFDVYTYDKLIDSLHFEAKCKNTEGELLSFIKAIKYIDKQVEISYDNITIYTDCQKVIQLCQSPTDRDKIIYKWFVDVIVPINVIKVDGHKKKALKDNNDLRFSIVDKRMRKILRSK